MVKSRKRSLFSVFKLSGTLPTSCKITNTGFSLYKPIDRSGSASLGTYCTQHDQSKAKQNKRESMASMKLYFAFVLLLSGLVAFGGTAACDVTCIQGGYITCDNYPGKRLDGCDCQCAPKGGVNCVLHLQHGPPFSCPAQQVQRLD